MTARACARATDDDPSPGCVSGSLAASTKKVPALARVGACIFRAYPTSVNCKTKQFLSVPEVWCVRIMWIVVRVLVVFFTLIGKESHAVKSELLSAVTRGSPLDPWCALLE